MEESKARALFESKSAEAYGFLPADGEGDDGDRRRIFYNGSYYKAEKMQGQWRYFKESVRIEGLTQSITNPPTQAEVQAIQDKLNELIGDFRR